MQRLAHELAAGTSRARCARSASAASASSAASARASAESASRCARERVEQLRRRARFSRASARSPRRQRLVLERLQLGRDEALGVLHRLAAPVVGRHLRRLALRDLDEEAVHAVVLDAQVRDAGARALARLELEQERVAVAADRAQLVELGVDGRRRSRRRRAAARPARRRSRASKRRDLGRAARAPRASMSSSTERFGRQAPARTSGSASSVARSPASSRGRTWRSAMRAAMRSTSLTCAQRLAQRLDAVAEQRGDRVVALARDPRARAAAASASWRSARLPMPVAQRVEQRQQRRRVVAAQRLRQLEVAARAPAAGRSARWSRCTASALHVRERAALRVLGVARAAPRRRRAPRRGPRRRSRRARRRAAARTACARRAQRRTATPAGASSSSPRRRRRGRHAGRASTSTSAGASRASQPASSALAALGEADLAARQRQPGEAEALPRRARPRAAARRACRRAVASSVTVPGVTMRTTLRSTGPLVVAESPTCSQIATDSPSLTSLREVALDRVHRHAGHRDRLRRRSAARGQRDVEQPARALARRRRRARRSRPSGRRASVSGMLGLDAQVLLHHRRVADGSVAAAATQALASPVRGSALMARARASLEDPLRSAAIAERVARPGHAGMSLGSGGSTSRPRRSGRRPCRR